jgi:hypothetical protein
MKSQSTNECLKAKFFQKSLNPVKSHERGKHQEVFTTTGTYPLSFVDVDKRFISCIDLD